MVTAGKSLAQKHRAVPRDCSTLIKRLGAYYDLLLVDHGALRQVYLNRAEISPGVWRSGQPAPAAIRGFARRGLRTIVNLRGASHGGGYCLELETCEMTGITLVDWRMISRELPSAASLLSFVEMLRGIERPFLMHCKSGADRAGFASAVYLLAIEDAPVDVARRQLSHRFLHFKTGKAGVLDAFIEAYAGFNAARPTPFLHWLAHHYDPEAIMAAFHCSRTWEGIAHRILCRE